jgi:hypothetical protein
MKLFMTRVLAQFLVVYLGFFIFEKIGGETLIAFVIQLLFVVLDLNSYCRL